MVGKQGGEGQRPILEVSAIRKTFGNGTVALQSVDMKVAAGSVHALVGANGAGKSTLVKILSGAQPATSGTITWDGETATWRDPLSARRAGVATNYQHVPLVPTLSVLENVFLGRAGYARRPRALAASFETLQERLGYRIDPEAVVGDLPIGARQMVALLQALAIGARLVLLDEPTASLAAGERQIVFDAVRRLSAQGTSFVYVSHFLDEILDLTDHVTVLRDGSVVLDCPTADLDETALVRAVVGKEILAVERAAAGRPAPDSPVVLSVRDLSSPAGISGISFDVRAGEIVGLAGLLGSGRSEIMHAVFGADRKARGDVRVDGKAVRRDARAAVRAGMSYVPEDRTRQGLFLTMPIWQNESLPDLPRLARAGVVPRRAAERARARAAVTDLAIKARSIDQPPSELSGGNAQKVVFGKWLYGERRRVWLLDEPTAGIDVGAKAELISLARRFAADGQAVLVACGDFEELLAVATRVLVVRKGRIVADLPVEEADEEKLLKISNGLGDRQPGQD